MELTLINQKVSIPVDNVMLEGEIILPPGATKLVIFSHGNGSNPFNPRNNMMTGVLHEEKIGTFLFDLLTAKEGAVHANRFNIELMTSRLMAVTRWLQDDEETGQLAMGYFGAGTGVASAFAASTKLGGLIKAVVSRGGRPDLVTALLPHIRIPVLLMVGGLDEDVVHLNRKAYEKLPKASLSVIRGASHLFEEPGKPEEVATLSAAWFKKYL